MENIYSFVFRGELTKTSLLSTQALKKNRTNNFFDIDTYNKLPFELIDTEYVSSAITMATIYACIAAFENSVRDFISKVLIEHIGVDWWNQAVSEKIRKKVEDRKTEDEKVRWHANRSDKLLNYTDLTDLISIINKNEVAFTPYIINIDWARQIFNSLEKSRNVVMHSGKLSGVDVERISMNMRDWINQVGA